MSNFRRTQDFHSYHKVIVFFSIVNPNFWFAEIQSWVFLNFITDLWHNKICNFYPLLMRPPPIGISGGIVFLGFLFVNACIRLSVHECIQACIRKFVSMISYQPMDGISLNFGWWCNWGNRWTDSVLKLRVKVKVAVMSDIWVSYCGGWRHPYQHLGIKVSFGFVLML